MSSTGITFGQIRQHLSMLDVGCRKCGRKGRYQVDRLIARYGAGAFGFALLADLTKDCPRRLNPTPQGIDPCDAHFPTLAEAMYPDLKTR